MFEMNALQAATFYLAIHMILFIFLAYRVVQIRQRDKINLGDNDDLDMQRRIRIHGNLSEYAPIYMLGLFGLVGADAPVHVVHGFGIVFTAARFLHAFNFYNTNKKVPFGRFFGTLFTWLSTLALAGTLLYFVWMG